MQNLGRIALFIIFLTTTIYATVTAKVEPRVISAGDDAVYVLTISGEDIKKPIIDSICGNDITSTGSQTSIQSINGDYQKSYSLRYSFTPFKSCTIDGVEVEIDGKIEKSNSVNVVVEPMKQDLRADFILLLEPSKKELYVGEPFTLTLLLKQKRNAQAVDSKFIAPDFKGFWTKEESQPKRTDDGEYITTTVVYKLAAQRSGVLSIPPAQLKIASRVGSNQWGTLIPQVKWKSYYSNELSITANPLPNGVNIIGDFSINVSVAKTEINSNEAVNLTINVNGNGNLEDIKSFKPYLQGVNVFDEKIVVKGNSLTQKLAFVSDRDFTIEPFKLEYFSIKTGKIETIQTKAIDIKVSGEVTSQESKVKIKRDETTSELNQEVKEVVVTKAIDKLWIALAFVVGIALGVLGMLFKARKGERRGKSIDLQDEKLLLIKLLPYKDNADVKEIVDILENNIYSKDKKSLDKKKVKEIIKSYSIS
ncbi:oxygen-tolerance protein [Sulfurimonas aquatica]|uniref:Oxygen-tolerance protein n=1 Tax=Sulfurimonas aquatica TaxID=2672570 RepID=A0A975GCG2_9BACT|nr:BatD family protein [Sulfurimonas aquatica]QSZ41273.1 oxygen-tolerance protein [Sulfurimonas aquatica]